ncbi:hypothetical protein Sjap_001336 [Stephania japonica]|uniref:Uncharacterized protein n=1 Tax=Stephania japonica TaxID=461633 RepID=A0AAP0KJU6_9MAGN
MKDNMMTMTMERRLRHERRRRPQHCRHGVPVPIRKKCRQHLILRRLTENLRYYKLRSLIPSQSSKKIRSHDDEDGFKAATNTTSLVSTRPLSPNLKIQEEECKPCCTSKSTEVIFENPEEPFVPTITIRKMEGSLLINAVVLKHVALTSNLFRIFEEEEKIGVLFENHYRTESKASHTIHLDVQLDYDVCTLEKKLCAWAGESTLLRRFNL